MAPKKNSTPIKPLESSNMTHEDEEWQQDTSKLQEQVQQISLLQRATKNDMEVSRKVWKITWMVLIMAWIPR